MFCVLYMLQWLKHYCRCDWILSELMNEVNVTISGIDIVYNIIQYVEPLTVDTSLIWTLSCVPIVVILYKTTPELKTPLQSGGPNGVHNIEVPLYNIITDSKSA